MAPSPALRPAVDHRHPATETCPYCEQAIPNDRAEEIRARYDRKQKQEAEAAKAREDRRVGELRAELEQASKAQLEKAQKENAAALEQAKKDVEAKQAAAREEGRKLAAAAAQEKLDTLAAAREEAARKFEESEKQKAAALKQFEGLKAQREAELAKRTSEVRAAMEADSNKKMSTLTAKHAEETRKLAEQMKTLQRRLDAEEGEGAEIVLIDVLRKKFPKDEFTPVNKSNGADIIHVIKHNKKVCGTIVYDSRNRNAWKPEFAANLRRDMLAAKAFHAILTSGKFPEKDRQFCIFDSTIVANPARVLMLVELLRTEIVRNFTQRVSEQNRERKTERLYQFIASEQFNNLIESMASNDDKLFALDKDERKVHEKTWEKREQLLMTSQKLHGSLRNEIDRITGTAETE